MSTIELVIRIPEDEYQNILRTGKASFCAVNAIEAGTLLPKGHGRLIDADALNVRMEQRMNEIGDDESIWESSNVATALDIFAPTIIEADT